MCIVQFSVILMNVTRIVFESPIHDDVIKNSLNNIMMKLVDNPLLQFQMIIAINQDSASCGCMLMCVTKTQSNLAHLN